MNVDATARRWQLGRLLRRAREAAGLTQTQVAHRIGCGQAKIHKIEAKLVEVSMPELEKLIELYRLPADRAAELRELAALDQRHGPARTKHPNSTTEFGELTELEPEAREIRCWHSERIPGTLQSEMYMLKLHDPAPGEVTQVMREWMARSRVFTVENPPLYRVFLSVSSLLRTPGGRDTQLRVDQTEHLLKLMNTYEQLELRILTFDANIRYMESDFQHLTFDDSQHCEFVYIEYPGGSRKCKSSSVLSGCREYWKMLDAAALDLPASREFLHRFAENGGSSAL